MAQELSETIGKRYQEIKALTPSDESAANIPEEPGVSVSTFLSASLFIFFFVIVFLGFIPLVIGRFRDFRPFQKALVLAFLAGALPLTMGLLLQRGGLLARASLLEIPRSVAIYDVDSDSFRVRWETSGEQYGALRYGTQPYPDALSRTVLDIGGLSPTKEHDVLVDGLEPDTDYYFEVLSGANWYDNEGVLPQVHTLPE